MNPYQTHQQAVSSCSYQWSSKSKSDNFTHKNGSKWVLFVLPDVDENAKVELCFPHSTVSPSLLTSLKLPPHLILPHSNSFPRILWHVDDTGSNGRLNIESASYLKYFYT
eukprot:scaffold31084_cov37-Cyclotella_meneghiniana.AAC.1